MSFNYNPETDYRNASDLVIVCMTCHGEDFREDGSCKGCEPELPQPETIHIRAPGELNTLTRCGLNWAINVIGNCRAENVSKYRNRTNCTICPNCER